MLHSECAFCFRSAVSDTFQFVYLWPLNNGIPKKNRREELDAQKHLRLGDLEHVNYFVALYLT